jgi:hypothetical protein
MSASVRSRALSTGLLLAAVTWQWALPVDPAAAATPPAVMPSFSVSAKTQTVKWRGKRLIVVRSVKVTGVRPAVKLAIRCRNCSRLRRVRIYLKKTAGSRQYTRVYWILPRGRGISIDATDAGMIGRWTVLAPGRRNRNKLVFRASGCLRQVEPTTRKRPRRIKCPSGATVAPNDTPVPVAPTAPPKPAPAVPAPAPPPAATPPFQICCTAVLAAASNQHIVSPNGRYELRMQGDGNLVLYYRLSAPYHALWSSVTSGSGADRAVMQSDGNLVVYRGSTPLWRSNTHGYPDATLVMQDDGNAVIYHNGVARWSTGTQGKT